MDAIVILGVLAFFVLAVGYVSFCARLMAGGTPTSDQVAEPTGHD